MYRNKAKNQKFKDTLIKCINYDENYLTNYKIIISCEICILYKKFYKNTT